VSSEGPRQGPHVTGESARNIALWRPDCKPAAANCARAGKPLRIHQLGRQRPYQASSSCCWRSSEKLLAWTIAGLATWPGWVLTLIFAKWWLERDVARGPAIRAPQGA